MERAETSGFAKRSKIQPSLLVAMVLAGIAPSMLGPMLPRLETHWQIDDAAAGPLFTAPFLSSVATGAVVGPLALRFGHLSLVRSGVVLSNSGTAMLAISPWPDAIGAVAMIGCGPGSSVPSANLCVAGSRALMPANFA
jgi:MFS family permease